MQKKEENMMRILKWGAVTEHVRECLPEESKLKLDTKVDPAR